jgi:hypothetical protein
VLHNTIAKMGFLSKFKKDEPSAAGAGDLAAVSPAASPDDPEKADAMAIENASQTPVAPSSPHIDPELEKRVLRKLDKRLVSLVFVLCKSQIPSLRVLY